MAYVRIMWDDCIFCGRPPCPICFVWVADNRVGDSDVVAATEARLKRGVNPAVKVAADLLGVPVGAATPAQVAAVSAGLERVHATAVAAKAGGGGGGGGGGGVGGTGSLEVVETAISVGGALAALGRAARRKAARAARQPSVLLDNIKVPEVAVAVAVKQQQTAIAVNAKESAYAALLKMDSLRVMQAEYTGSAPQRLKW